MDNRLVVILTLAGLVATVLMIVCLVLVVERAKDKKNGIHNIKKISHKKLMRSQTELLLQKMREMKTEVESLKQQNRNIEKMLGCIFVEKVNKLKPKKTDHPHKLEYGVTTLSFPFSCPDEDLSKVSIHMSSRDWCAIENSPQWSALEELYSKLKNKCSRCTPQEKQSE